MTTTELSAPVLDASALLAFVLKEPGREVVSLAISGGAVIGAVNYAEALSKLTEKVGSAWVWEERICEMTRSRLVIEPFLEGDAVRAAELRPLSRRQGLSLGDRACLAIATRLGARVLTSDRAWREVPDLAVPVMLIR